MGPKKAQQGTAVHCGEDLNADSRARVECGSEALLHEFLSSWSPEYLPQCPRAGVRQRSLLPWHSAHRSHGTATAHCPQSPQPSCEGPKGVRYQDQANGASVRAGGHQLGPWFCTSLDAVTQKETCLEGQARGAAWELVVHLCQVVRNCP